MTLLVVLLIHAVGKSCRRGLVDDTLDLQSGDFAGVLGGLTLSVGEVRGNGDDRLGNRLTQVAFRVGLQLVTGSLREISWGV